MTLFELRQLIETHITVKDAFFSIGIFCGIALLWFKKMERL